ncbi:hypothetical protein ACO0K2_17725 [Undibacterium sp. MH2W]|uniref:hypothetical protein n=1 Tax=Undibacterium sp. MH2W TaxID=3413044 RepID=UPI003BF176EC
MKKTNSYRLQVLLAKLTHLIQAPRPISQKEGLKEGPGFYLDSFGNFLTKLATGFFILLAGLVIIIISGLFISLLIFLSSH